MKENKKIFISLRILETESEQIDKIAEFKGATRSDILREGIELMWEKYGKKANDYRLDQLIKEQNDAQRYRFMSEK